MQAKWDISPSVPIYLECQMKLWLKRTDYQTNYSYICSVNSEPRPRTQNLKESHNTSGNWTSCNSSTFSAGFFPTYCGSAAGISQPVQWVQHKIAEVRRERRNGDVDFVPNAENNQALDERRSDQCIYMNKL